MISIIGPTAEFHLAALVVEWKPGDVYLAGAFEDTGRHIQTRSVVPDYHVGGVRAVEALVRTGINVSSRSLCRNVNQIIRNLLAKMAE